MVLETGLASEEKVLAAMVRAREEDLSPGLVLTELMGVDEAQFARQVADRLRLSWIDLTAATPQPSALELVPPSLARRVSALPLVCDEKTVTVAMAFPFDAEGIADLEYVTNRRVRVHVAPLGAIARAVGEHYSTERLGAASVSLREAAVLAEGHRSAFSVALLSEGRGRYPGLVAANVAYWLAGAGKNVLLADLATPVEEVASIVGFTPERALLDHLNNPRTVGKAIAEAPGGFSFLGGMPAGFAPQQLAPAKRRGLYRRLALIAQKFDMSIFTLWPVSSPIAAGFVLACDLAAVLVNARRPEGGYLALKTVVEVHALAAVKCPGAGTATPVEPPGMGIVATDVHSESEGKDLFSRSVAALSDAFGADDGYIPSALTYLGPLFADDAHVELARRKGVVFGELFPRRTSWLCLEALARKLLLASEHGRKRESVKNGLRKFAHMTDEEM